METTLCQNYFQYANSISKNVFLFCKSKNSITLMVLGIQADIKIRNNKGPTVKMTVQRTNMDCGMK